MWMLPVLAVLRTYCHILNISYIIIYNIIGVNYMKSIKNHNFIFLNIMFF